MDWGRAVPGSFTGIPDFAGNALQVLLNTSCPAVANTGQGTIPALVLPGENRKCGSHLLQNTSVKSEIISRF
ncbi:hypothetical protein ASZ90_014618 [hydrocarbon metagenome]|uniref:Uncharacterized protein n=1 Tax=hydrocarbon metagenome TaxID=938273 RepID=A0A0W8F546_9ZZZZ